MTTNLVMSGGPLHDFDATTAALVEILGKSGVSSTIVDDLHTAVDMLSTDPGAWDLVTVNALRWRMTGDRHAHLREGWSFELRDDEAATVERYVRSGGGLLACHSAAICFDGHPRWAACIGATWDWDRSSHPPLGPARVSRTDAGRRHEITSGITDFTTRDEVYGFLDASLDLEPLLTSPHGGVEHPVLWAREVGRGRVVTDLLGHDDAAVRQPTHRTILQRAVRWLTEPARTRDRTRHEERSGPTP